MSLDDHPRHEPILRSRGSLRRKTSVDFLRNQPLSPEFSLDRGDLTPELASEHGSPAREGSPLFDQETEEIGGQIDSNMTSSTDGKNRLERFTFTFIDS